MTDLVVSVLPCAFCGTGEAAVAVHLRAVRTVTCASVSLGSERPEHPALSFTGTPAGPCPHLMTLALSAHWARLLRPEGRPDGGPTGALTLRWRHPSAVRVPSDRLARLADAGQGLRPFRQPLVTPFRVVGVTHEGVVAGRPATRSWRWWMRADAVFALDPERLGEELQSAALR